MNIHVCLFHFSPVSFQSFYSYGDLFSETWRAFTDYDIIHLKTYDSKRVGVCARSHSTLDQEAPSLNVKKSLLLHFGYIEISFLVAHFYLLATFNGIL